MTPDEQLDEWVKGNPIHNPDRDECCPDFSCCDRSLLAPYEVRKAFAEASDKDRSKMLGMFFSGLTTSLNINAYISGDGSLD